MNGDGSDGDKCSDGRGGGLGKGMGLLVVWGEGGRKAVVTGTVVIKMEIVIFPHYHTTAAVT
ncbi:hypothetical protein E2C01_093602 [Portunus trituberculatus]|uniref:Uncharacterized protein n=1 Tax=Portunus trituberculatus TaxID=210409 RepID=A0A5B7JQ82_PORTR|nr:hypothetical protein [Portunus trituberculatus]